MSQGSAGGEHAANYRSGLIDDAGRKLFAKFMGLLTQKDVFKPLSACYACGSARHPKDSRTGWELVRNADVLSSDVCCNDITKPYV